MFIKCKHLILVLTVFFHLKFNESTWSWCNGHCSNMTLKNVKWMKVRKLKYFLSCVVLKYFSSLNRMKSYNVVRDESILL